MLNNFRLRLISATILSSVSVLLIYLGDNYFNLAANQVDYTITANGTYGYVLFAPVQFVRVRLVSLSGGTPSVATVLGTI